MKTLESKKNLYVQPETEVIELDYQVGLLADSMNDLCTDAYDCDSDGCEEYDPCDAF